MCIARAPKVPSVQQIAGGPPPPSVAIDDPAVMIARDRERRRQSQRSGRQSTILTRQRANGESDAPLMPGAQQDAASAPRRTLLGS